MSALSSGVNIREKMSSLICEDEDIGGPNCPVYSGPIAVYRFSLAMVLFYFTFMMLTLGVSTSRTFRAYLHNGYLRTFLKYKFNNKKLLNAI